MRFEAPLRITAVAAVLALALTGLVVREGTARARGQEVALAITGYDPRELLTGHYIRFQIVHEAPPGTACPPGADQSWPRGKTTWVALRREGTRHAPAGVAERRSEAAKLGEVTVRGRLTCVAPVVSPPDAGAAQAEPTRTTLDLGVDRLHIDQAQAEAMERDLLRRAEAHAVFSVASDGTPRLKGLIVNGRRVDLDWF
ncbi:GDYXXLXY domain-containing protein [uncultured Phenylobacterium sp.]|uniref:GDYXXLXY domain-containing protein n=1 Tax=uncultured Phenylobacterium sp. TaxID=349273 RepID=UPI0025D784CE|nr:GDYXXLXY domain-containing protein [uncultured Phenylobacterium sp.]